MIDQGCSCYQYTEENFESSDDADHVSVASFDLFYLKSLENKLFQLRSVGFSKTAAMSYVLKQSAGLEPEILHA